MREEDYQCEGGDGVIFKLLDQRWPQKDRSDEIAEHVPEIFALKAKEGETVQTNCPVATYDLSPCRITCWSVEGDEWTKPEKAHEPIRLPVGKYWVGETVFSMSTSVPRLPGTVGDDEVLMTQWTRKQSRQLDQHVKRLGQGLSKPKPYHVIEMFSRPRFAQQTATRGQSCLSADLLTG